MIESLTVMFWLLVGHALADYPLQGPYLAQAKNRNSSLGRDGAWRWALGCHAMIHGGAVALATGSVVLGVCETVAHAVIDFAKCEGWLSYDTDQALHVVCKAVWFAVWALAL